MRVESEKWKFTFTTNYWIGKFDSRREKDIKRQGKVRKMRVESDDNRQIDQTSISTHVKLKGSKLYIGINYVPLEALYASKSIEVVGYIQY